MDDERVQRFLTDGFVKIEGAFPSRVAADCARLLWRETGYEPDDPDTWKEPVVRVNGMAQGPFAAAANSPALHEAFDLLVGAGRWEPRYALGTFPLRFPHPEEPDDAGWHIEGSYLPEGEQRYFANLRSRDRALLMLFLFSDVTEADAPTRIRVGSHLDVPPLLEPYGEAGASILELGPLLDRASAHRPLAYATGRPGDVYLCHPFLVHAAQPHHGTRPRFMAQPPLHPAVPCALERADGAYSPVELAIRRGLAG
ncbi:phytanoyl-CoA dioxygenase family protein [Streptomyces roseochromogenus]|uniref:Phytanoyl-CoA dioxygenase n=1 Tax=Streptomyces roseochromogenus subsp. oscitans DS 12.976 TaxID=1352936 RepID=V6KSK8_STRRC|nr:phytanoyl-CoA dioxygenase family protein [Streptomyces roseochromogenus]EST35122.1 phytanoyl-CoA dioxygenase [Streptomyces roseochromogenus subsp. oscitans DS 12.976]